MAINKSEISCNLGREGDRVKLLGIVFGYQEKLWESANVFYKGPDCKCFRLYKLQSQSLGGTFSLVSFNDPLSMFFKKL